MQRDAPLTPPPEAPRPKLARWLFDRDLDYGAAGERLGVTGETVRRWCMRFDDERRTVPGRPVLDKIFQWTAGAVTPADFWPPQMAAAPVIRPEIADRLEYDLPLPASETVSAEAPP
jgi:hypothetical protein